MYSDILVYVKFLSSKKVNKIYPKSIKIKNNTLFLKLYDIIGETLLVKKII